MFIETKVLQKRKKEKPSGGGGGKGTKCIQRNM
jgi:hypothetical protein